MFRSKLIQGAAIAALFCAATAGAQTPEVEALRARIEKQEAELAELRAAVERLAPKPAAPAPPPAQPVTAGAGTIRLNGLLQGWFASADAGFQDTFRIRRAELKLSGDLGKTAGWTVMIDPAKALSVNNGAVNQSSRILQDAFLTYGVPARVSLIGGQFKVPISREGLESSAALDTVERALFLSDRARGGAYGDVRDIGVAVRRSTNLYDATLGVFNGTGESQNDVDANERKAVSGRGPLKLKSELMAGRVDQWDPDTDGEAAAAAARERDFIAGANFDVTQFLRLQANLVRKTYAADSVRDRNLLLLNLQTSC